MEKRATSGIDVKKKRGREQIAFLIILNICLWLLYTVTRNKYAYNLFYEVLNETGETSDYVSEYLRSQSLANVTLYHEIPSHYGLSRAVTYSTVSSDNAQAVKWIVINTITYPLLLYFHFHSSCCLSIMWKLCYHLELESF